jgi:hypothetical protein
MYIIYVLIQIIIHISYEVIKYMTRRDFLLSYKMYDNRDVQCEYSSLSCQGCIKYILHPHEGVHKSIARIHPK